MEVDNKFAFEGILPEGTQRNWKANREILLRSGNAGAVSIVTGKQIGRAHV